MNRLRSAHPGTQRGAAALIVVMLLFFLISLVAAYAARNLIFEQKTSANQFRATQAFEAAEAGLEWALAMLNGGRIDASCRGSTNVADSSFRTRYLVQAAGTYTPSTWNSAGVPESFRPSCVRSDDPANPWTCSCPTAGVPVLAAPGGAGVFPAFRVCLERVPLDPLVANQPGAVRVVSTGGTSLATVDQPCDQGGQGTNGEATASVSVVAALSSALPAPPVAALTAGRNFVQEGGNLTLVNVDPLSTGLTMHVGAGAATLSGTLTRHTLAGTPEPNSTVLDPTLGSLTADQMFTSRFHMAMATYKTQPATVIVDCSSDCPNRLQQAVQGNPGRIVWVDGNVQLSGNLNLGSDNEPAMVMVDGDVRIEGNVNVVGFLSSQTDMLINSANLNVRGAVAAARDVRVDSNVTIEYNPAHPTQPTLIPQVLTHLRQASGSLVRVPGSWRDFP